MNDLKYTRILRTVTETPWAILPGKLAVIRDLLAFRAAGGVLTAEEVRERLAADDVTNASVGARTSPTKQQGIAVLSLVGTIITRADAFSEMSGAVSTQRFTKDFRAALADPDVGAIVIDVDSPGGQVSGVAELADEIYQARGVKPVTAVANSLAASAAYWIASAADELAVIPTGEVGSIGVFAMHQDISQALDQEGISINLIAAGRYKTEGNPFEPLGEEARAYIQERVDDYYAMFTAAISRNRNVTIGAVVNGFGEGRVVGAETAVSLGMADRVATLDEVVDGILSDLAAPARARAAVEFRKRRLRANSR